MNVITLDADGFEHACSELAVRLMDRGQYDAVVGVRTGGAVVAGKVYKILLQADSSMKYFEAGAVRSTTAAKKKGIVTAMIRRMPRIFQDVLRNIEHFFVALTTALRFEKQRSAQIDIDLQEFLTASGRVRLCIIDDAIDSGATIKSLYDKVKKMAPEVEITVAVLVVTLRRPVVRPDVSVFDGVLIRFPWAIDFRESSGE